MWFLWNYKGSHDDPGFGKGLVGKFAVYVHDTPTNHSHHLIFANWEYIPCKYKKKVNCLHLIFSFLIVAMR